MAALPLSDANNDAPPGMVLVGGGTFSMGAAGSHALPREFPVHPVQVHSFYLDTTEVTNAQFRAFVAATGYITVAEKPIDWKTLELQLPPGTPEPAPADLQPGSLVFTPPPAVYGLDNWSNGGAGCRAPAGMRLKVREAISMEGNSILWCTLPTAMRWLMPNGPGSACLRRPNGNGLLVEDVRMLYIPGVRKMSIRAYQCAISGRVVSRLTPQ